MTHYFNIGNEKCACFIPISIKLVNQVKKHQGIFDSVEEAILSAQQGYYSIGVIVFYDIIKEVFNQNKKEDADIRNIPAHDMLKGRASKEMYEKLLSKTKLFAEMQQKREIDKLGETMFVTTVFDMWEEYKLKFDGLNLKDDPEYIKYRKQYAIDSK